MENNKTFGSFLISKRMEHEMSARQLAIALDYSAVYICDIEKDRRPVPDDILEKLPALLHLTEAETEEMYDLAARSRNTVSAGTCWWNGWQIQSSPRNTVNSGR